ncbi:hypothetical protein [Klenkia sp. PcliD-1-E]|uniref:DUF6414 family protein n=1 Tax=Klenkia sp. PcliD-1-E TaxID=2954492 RepID=UPI002096BECF|nr:hypothetical protein [Klenkia sp. PcliD-1-E]MCO7221512.1 hypothetical protein [Klenkia sp. PcliD-1-E]
MSLRSLLVSQRETIPEQVSRAISQAEETEVTGKVSADAFVVNSEVGSRFQTSNSNSVQTSRKAIVQTLFKELRDDCDLDYALEVRIATPKKLDDLTAIQQEEERSIAAPVTGLSRGALVEVEVELEVDPVFKLGTLISEYASMVEEYPEVFDTAARAGLRDAEPVNRILQRLLAGLIPIRAKATSLSVIEVDGQEYVVHNDAVAGLEVERRPLEVVGVTEHIGYWKDIRRVLFSSAPVTMLCRVARDGLHQTWTPVKLADVFREAVPTLVDQINEASRTGVGSLGVISGQNAQQELVVRALDFYKEKLLAAAAIELGTAEEVEIAHIARAAGPEASSISGQRRAYAAVREVIERRTGHSVLDPDADLAARQEARVAVGLPLFPGLAATPVLPVRASDPDVRRGDRLLDVEVIAIYW